MRLPRKTKKFFSVASRFGLRYMPLPPDGASRARRRRYHRWIAHLKRDQYERALIRLSQLMDVHAEDLDSPGGRELIALAKWINAYELKRWPVVAAHVKAHGDV